LFDEKGKTMIKQMYTQANRPMEITTPLGPDALLLAGFTGREAISQSFQFQLDLLAENGREIAFDKLLGQPVAIRLALGGGKNRYFHGIVSRFTQGMRDDTFTSYRAEVVPQLWLLTRRIQSRMFQHLSVPAILKKVFQGLDVGYEIMGTYHPRDYCVQYRESDFAFASRLMEEEGIYYFFKHTADGHKMIVANTPQSHPDLPEQSKIIFDETQSGSRARCRITEWEKVQELRSGKVTLWDHCFELPHRHLEADKTILDSVSVGKVTHKLRVANNEELEIYDFPGEYAQRFDGVDPGGAEQPAELQKIYDDKQRTAVVRMQQEALAGLVVQGAGYCRQFVSGHKFTLARHFNADGPYLITGVEHTAKGAGHFRSDNGVPFAYHNRFTCIPLALPFRPARVTPRPRVQGTQTAVVVGVPGPEEIYTDKYGRVKVQFHWDREGKYDPASSCWIRVSTFWAGKQWGAIHIPRRGQEVIVDFLEGDPDQPIIIGSVYNAEMMPPHPLPENRKVSGVVTRSNQSAGGGNNRISYDDAHGKEKINIHAQNDMSTFVENNEDIVVGANQDVNITGEHTLTVGQTQAVSIGGNRVHECGGTDHRWAKGLMTIKSDTQIMLSVEGSSITIAKGGIALLSNGDISITSTGGSIVINGKPVRINC
jgi:type VI secretion system secreted protein VgrG